MSSVPLEDYAGSSWPFEYIQPQGVTWYSLGMDWQRALRIGILTGIFATPFIALIVSSNLFFPFITGKNFTFRILVEVIFALWVVLALYAPEYRPRKSLAMIVGALFVVAIGISTVVAENPTKAFWSNFERMEGYITILHLAAYVVVLTSVMKTEELWRRFFNTSLVAAAIVAIYAVFQLLGAFTINQGDTRVDATLGNATYFAVFMLIHAFVALYGLVHWSNGMRWLQALYGGVFLLTSVMVFYSATRGSILGLMGGLFLAGLIATVIGGGRMRTVGIGAIGVIIILSGIFFAVKDTGVVRDHPILGRIASISLTDGTTRFAIWNMAYQGFMERPVFGWGQDGFNYVFNKYYESKLYTQEPWFDRAHNVVLDWLVAGGIVGMLLYLSLYFVLIYYLWRPGTVFSISERAVLTGLLAGYAFHNLFVFDHLMSYIMFMLLFSYIVVRAVPERRGTWVLPESTLSMTAGVTVVALLLIMYGANYGGHAAGTEVIQGLSPQAGGIEKNLLYFERAASRSGLGQQEVGEQFLQFALQVRAMNIGDQTFQLKVATAARQNFVSVIDGAPNDARLLVFFGSFLRQFGDVAGARSALMRALELSPQKQGILYEIAILNIAEKRYAEALIVLEELNRTAPNYGNAQVVYATAALLAGKLDLASKILIAKYGTDEPDDPSVIQAYAQAQQYTKAIRMAERRVAADPTNTEKYTLLAGTYLSAGDTAGAASALRRAIVANPSFKAQAEQYIQQIESGALR